MTMSWIQIAKKLSTTLLFTEHYIYNQAHQEYLDLSRLKDAMGAELRGGAKWGLIGTTPLMAASKDGRIDRVAYLLANHADPHALNINGWTALMDATYEGHVEVAWTLLYSGARARDEKNDMTALHWAAMQGDLPMVQMLLAYRADPRAEDKEGLKAGDLVRHNGHLAVVAVLEEATRVPSLLQTCMRVILQATPPSRLQELPLPPLIMRNFVAGTK